MGKLKSFLGCVGVTAVMLVIARLLPSTFNVIFPQFTDISLILFVLLLPVAWLAVRRLFKGQYSGCICANLYIFFIIEAFGAAGILLDLFSAVVSQFSDPLTYLGSLIPVLLFESVYILLCLYFISATPNSKDSNKKAKDQPLPKSDDTALQADSDFEQLSFELPAESPAPAQQPARKADWKLIVAVSLCAFLLCCVVFLLHRNSTLRSECDRLSEEVPASHQAGYDEGYAAGADAAYDAAFEKGFQDATKKCTSFIVNNDSPVVVKRTLGIDFISAYQKDVTRRYAQAYTDGIIALFDREIDYSILSDEQLSDILEASRR